MFHSKKELLEFIDKNNAYSYADFKRLLRYSHGRCSYQISKKYGLSLKQLKKEKIFDLLDNDYSVKEISNMLDTSISVIYKYYKEHKERKKKIKYKITRTKCLRILHKYNFSLNKIYRNEYISPDKMKRTIKECGLEKYYLDNRYEQPLHKRKRGELTDKAFKLFNQYPNALQRTGSEIAILLNCDCREANRLRRKYNELHK